jgi:hypothetical protein
VPAAPIEWKIFAKARNMTRHRLPKKEAIKPD